MIEALKDIPVEDAIAEAKMELEGALRYGLVVGEATHVIDREHVEKALAIIKLIDKAQR
jgi:hypothetical protein